MERNKSCCFIGHRVVEDKSVVEKLKPLIIDLIEKSRVKTFYFGSKSEFNDICHEAVSEIKQKYVDIERIGVVCKSESVVLAEDAKKMQRSLDVVLGEGTKKIQGFEAELRLESVEKSGRNSYIKRNEEMIKLSNYCVFYLSEKYTTQKKKSSGTKIAYEFAKKKDKYIIKLQ